MLYIVSTVVQTIQRKVVSATLAGDIPGNLARPLQLLGVTGVYVLGVYPSVGYEDFYNL